VARNRRTPNIHPETVRRENQFALARNEFLSSHRPKLRLKHIWFATPDGETPTHNIRNQPLTVTLDIVNIGRTDAFIDFINFTTLILFSGDHLPQRPPYDNPDHPVNNFGLRKVEPG